ncbi:MAG: sodium-extruding oxaloacetate decarboxylase subunit alpha [Pseudomonadota bacterium]
MTAKSVKQDKVLVTETVLRDAHQSLLATRMRTEDMLPICDKLDRVGFWSLEVWGGATFDASLRYLKEDPWERLRQLRSALPNTRLQMLLRGQNLLGYRHYADDVVEAFIERAAANGIDVFRVFDAMNDLRNLETSIRAVKRQGKHAQGAISYTVSPVHTVAHFVDLAQRLAEMGCDSLCVKDMAGLLTPPRAFELFTALRQSVNLPLSCHSHDTAGLSAMNHLRAIDGGANMIDTAVSALCCGTSHAATESMVAALRDTPQDTGLDLQLLQEIASYFREVRKKYAQFESEFTGIDTRVQSNQVPGGMVSNLVNQLRDQGALDRLDEVLAEIPRVRADFGYPPLVTPTSQIVGTQAVFNVLTGKRYHTITNETKNYLLGLYGQPLGKVNPELRRLAIGDATPVSERPADRLAPELNRLTEAVQDVAHSPEDVLSYALFPEIALKFFEARAAGRLTPEPLPPVPVEAPAPQGTPTEFSVTMHGENYHIRILGTGHPHAAQRTYFVAVDGLPEEVYVEILDAASATEGEAAPLRTRIKGSRRPQASRAGHVATFMPGTIVEVLVREGDMVKAGDPVLVTEAMKMESEVQAPISGKVVAVHVAKGDAVNPDEVLVEIE